ncbi:MAG: hypothetical protein COV67_11625 [Nitrospinae bacterium CG11_big_fil_rev_8_21_14_0_20_56_8]|nr:MAG: hypothetical protein COV67_11625 [Nitrospinae bacterium CG11_big_fil_rev_8_21_14_0_20_56_8]
MIVKEIMVTKPITIGKSDSLKKAQDLMVENSIRHLPVVEKSKLLGIITESDIRGAFIYQGNGENKEVFQFNPAKMLVIDYMTQNPLSVAPETNIEDAALMMYQNKIGGLPVTQDGRLVGIISIMDMLGLLVDMMGILHSSSRVDVLIDKNQEAMDRVEKIIAEQGLEVIATALEPYSKGKNKQVCAIRLDLCETGPLVQALEKAGFKVLDAID